VILPAVPGRHKVFSTTKRVAARNPPLSYATKRRSFLAGIEPEPLHQFEGRPLVSGTGTCLNQAAKMLITP